MVDVEDISKTTCVATTTRKHMTGPRSMPAGVHSLPLSTQLSGSAEVVAPEMPGLCRVLDTPTARVATKGEAAGLDGESGTSKAVAATGEAEVEEAALGRVVNTPSAVADAALELGTV